MKTNITGNESENLYFFDMRKTKQTQEFPWSIRPIRIKVKQLRPCPALADLNRIATGANPHPSLNKHTSDIAAVSLICAPIIFGRKVSDGFVAGTQSANQIIHSFNQNDKIDAVQISSKSLEQLKAFVVFDAFINPIVMSTLYDKKDFGDIFKYIKRNQELFEIFKSMSEVSNLNSLAKFMGVSRGTLRTKSNEFEVCQDEPTEIGSILTVLET